MLDEVTRLRGKRVEVIANNIVYKGVLVDVTEEDVSLQTDTQWIFLSLGDVVSIREAPLLTSG